MLAKVAMSHRTALLTVKDGDWGATSLKAKIGDVVELLEQLSQFLIPD